MLIPGAGKKGRMTKRSLSHCQRWIRPVSRVSEGEARAGTYDVVRVVHVRLHLSLDPNEGGSVIGRGGVRGTYSSMLSASTISTDPTSFLLGEVTDSGVPSAPTTPALWR